MRLVKTAWRSGYHGLACIIAIAWDTTFSPVDVRTLAARHQAISGGRLIFDRQADGRAKTGRAALGTVSKRTERLVALYLERLAIELHPDAILFRNRSGNVYGRESLAHDFAAVRALIFPGDEPPLNGYAPVWCRRGNRRRRGAAGLVRQTRQLDRPIKHTSQDLRARRY